MFGDSIAMRLPTISQIITPNMFSLNDVIVTHLL